MAPRTIIAVLLLALVLPATASAGDRPSTDYVGFDTRATKVANAHVRAGMSIALTRTTLAALGHEARPSASYVPPGTPGYRTIAGPTNAWLRPLATPDRDAARDRLRLGGWKSGDSVTLLYLGSADRADAMALQVQRDLAEVGVVVQLREYTDRAQYLRVLRSRNRPAHAELFLFGWGAATRDAGAFLASQTCAHAANFTRHCSTRFDNRLKRARAVRDRRERFRRYAVIESMLTGRGGAHPVAAFLSYYG